VPQKLLTGSVPACGPGGLLPENINFSREKPRKTRGISGNENAAICNFWLF